MYVLKHYCKPMFGCKDEVQFDYLLRLLLKLTHQALGILNNRRLIQETHGIA
jgi:hypothetical protein